MVYLWLLLAAAFVLLILLPPIFFAFVGLPDPTEDEFELVAAGAPLYSPEEVELLADETGIPVEALAAYLSGAQAFGIDWTILAGVGRMECNHGQSTLDGCDPPGTINGSGARGPMQFLGNTWRTSAGQFDLDVSGPAIRLGQESQGYATDGDGDGDADPWSWLDAAHAAARYLERQGVNENRERAAFAYFHGGGAPFDPDHFYHRGVISYANQYREVEQRLQESGRLMSDGASGTLTSVGCPSGGSITVDASIAGRLQTLLLAASSSGINLCGSGWRSHEDQIRLRTQNGCPDVWSSPASSCRTPTAIPGTSMHETGLAIDFNCNGSLIRSRSSPCYQWLDVHAVTYGLYNLPSEPWHWSVDGT